MSGTEDPPAELLDPVQATQALKGALDEVARLMGTDERNAQAIEIWEEMMQRLVPEVGERAAALASIIDELEDPISPEDMAGMAPTLRQIADLVGDIAEIKPPDPIHVCLNYLRRQDERQARIEKKLDWHMRVAHGNLAEGWVDA